MDRSRRLTLEDRIIIEKMLHENRKHKEICEAIKISRSTLYRDIKKCSGAYSAKESHENTNRQPIDYEIIGKGLEISLYYHTQTNTKNGLGGNVSVTVETPQSNLEKY